MVDELIRKSEHEKSGFYLTDYDGLSETIAELEKKKQKQFLLE